jgi:hypothetical protein
VFPEDDVRPELEALTDGAAITALLRPEAAPTEAASRVLAYRPRRRCALRYDWAGLAPPAIGKLEQGAAVRHDALLRLWSRRGRGFGMPRPLACDPAVDCRFEDFVEGARIEDAGVPLPTALELVMTALPALHATPVDGLPAQGAAQVLRRMERRVIPRVTAALGDERGPWDAFGARLHARAAELAPRRARTVHGDLHTANVLLGDDGPVFIDLDSLAAGDPAFDLALLGTRVVFLAMYTGDDVVAAAAAVASLPARYEEAGGDHVPDEAFAWFMAALLVGRQVKGAIQHLAPGAHELIPALRDLATRTLDARRFDASCAAVD